MNRLITFPASQGPPHCVTHTWMAHDSDKGPDDRYLFVISPSEASAIICYDPVFSQHLVICQGDKELCSEWIHRHFGDDLLDRGFKIDGDGHAYHYRGITRNTCLIWMKVPSAQDAPLVFSLLAHEAVHAAYAVMECRGIKPDFNNEEFVAYYVQWVMNCYLQCIGLPSEDNSMFQKTCGQLPD